MSIDLFPQLLNRLTSRINQQWLGHIRASGLTIARWQVLTVLSRFNGSRVGTIADLSGTEQPAVSRVIDQMVRDGLVERRPAADDSRAVEVWITDEGTRLYRELLPVGQSFVEELFRNFDNEESRTLMRHLEQLFLDMPPVSEKPPGDKVISINKR